METQKFHETTLGMFYKLVFPNARSRIFLCNNVTLGYHSGGGGEVNHTTTTASPVNRGFREIQPVIVFNVQY